jgi:hypothetical protein
LWVAAVIFFVISHFLAEKRGGQKKAAKKRVFVKNDLNLAKSKTFKIRFALKLLFNKTCKQIPNIRFNRFQSILG